MVVIVIRAGGSVIAAYHSVICAVASVIAALRKVFRNCVRVIVAVISAIRALQHIFDKDASAFAFWLSGKLICIFLLRLVS